MGIDSLSPSVRPLNAPGILSEAKGLLPSDVLIRHALLIGLDDLRKNPWQLQLIFAGLLDDPWTSDLYGAKEVSKAINWFLKTDIPVIMDYTLAPGAPMPVIVIGLQESVEAEATLGDIHYVPSQDAESEWEPLTQKFSATYDPVTGLVVPSIDVIVNSMMVLIDKVGNRYSVLDVQVDANDKENFLIDKGLINPDLSQCVLEWKNNRVSVNLESCNFKETFNIISNVKGETSYLLYLHSIVVYCLMRYKKSLLEARGFERTSISSTKVMQNNSLGSPGVENIWCRVTTITGYSKTYWATETSDRIAKANYGAGPDGLLVSQLNFLPNSFKTDPSQTDPSFLSGDGIGVRL